MKIEIKPLTLTWRVIRERYERLTAVQGLRGINMLAAYSHNLAKLKELYEASNFAVQYPESDEHRLFEETRIREFANLATVDGVVKKKVVPVGKSFQEVFDVDPHSPETIKLTQAIEERFKKVIAKRKEEEERWNAELDEEVPLEYLPKFWKAPFAESPEGDINSYMAVEWFLKDIPDLSE